MTTTILVEARHGAQRLPGKLSAPLGAASLLARTLARCRAIAGVEGWVCAVADDSASTPLAAQAQKLGWQVVRGAEEDRLARLTKAASESGAERIVLVAGDSPFLDPEIAGRTVQLLCDADVDYAAADMPPLWPEGLECEVFSARLMHWAEALSRRPDQRAQPTAWIRTQPGLRRACLAGPGGGLERLRWTIDWPEDLAFAQAVFEALGETAANADAAEIAALCLRRPDLPALNAGRVDARRLACPRRAEVVVTAPTDLMHAA